MSDTAAAERMVERLLAVTWDVDAAYKHSNSRARLAREFLRRTAQWAVAVGAEKGWPFSDLAGSLDPDVAVEPALLAKLELDPQSAYPFPVPPRWIGRESSGRRGDAARSCAAEVSTQPGVRRWAA